MNEANYISRKCKNESEIEKITSIRRFQLGQNEWTANAKYHTRISRKLQYSLSNTRFLKLPQFNNISHPQKEKLDIQLTDPRPTLRQHLSRTRRPTNESCTVPNCPINNTDLCYRIYLVYQIQCVICKEFSFSSTVRLLDMHVKEHATTRSLHSINTILTKDIQIKILVTKRDLGNLRIKDSLLIQKFNP